MNTYALKFLLCSYFGIALNSEEDWIIDTCINKAYEDATNQGAFNALIAKNDIESKELVSQAKEKAKGEILRPLIQKILTNSLLEEGWHKKACTDICEVFNKEKKIRCKNRDSAFTIGNAQKWVNMTFKYLYLIAVAFQELEETRNKGWVKNVVEKSEKFHVPVDSYILQKLKKAGEKNVKGRGEEYYYVDAADNDKKTWSSIDRYDLYEEIQRKIADSVPKEYSNKNILEWENDAWIEMALIRKERKRRLKSNG